MRQDLCGTGLHTTLHPRRYDDTASTYRTWVRVYSLTLLALYCFDSNVHWHLGAMEMDMSQDCWGAKYGHQICPVEYSLMSPYDRKQKSHNYMFDRTVLVPCYVEWAFCHPTCLHWFPTACSQERWRDEKNRPHFWRLLVEMYLRRYAVS